MKNLPAYALSIFACFVFIFFLSGELLAKPVNSAQAEKIVRGWLKNDAKPLGMELGEKIKKTEVFKDADGQAVYYIVYLDPVGFVIVSADDRVEPIVGFVNGDKYDPSNDNPLGALVSRDLPERVSASRRLETTLAGGVQKKDLTSGEVILQEASSKSKEKWDTLSASADSIEPMSISGVSDVRVAPLTQSEWNQFTVCDVNCYNYYTPNNGYCGCVATAMAQLMRYFQYPTAGIGVNSFTIYVNGNPETAYTRGGDGSGGAYNWSQMTLVPDCSITPAQQQAIGDLCYDAGVAVNMQYTSSGAGAYLYYARTALQSTFHYSNAIGGGYYNSIANIGSGLNGMINPNLDAGHPVILGIFDANDEGHAVVADGYGYNSSTLYHHINMGWGGSYNAWYNLPNIDDGYDPFDVVTYCIYNVYISGTGEIISGRVIDGSGNPLSGAAVTAQGTGGPYSTTTNSNGIYALINVPSSSTYTVSVTKTCFSFSNQTVTTGYSQSSTSHNQQVTSGNLWGVNFQGMSPDLNKDGKVNMFDYAILASQWQQAPGVPSADIAPPGGDGIVNFQDLAVMAEEWLAGE